MKNRSSTDEAQNKPFVWWECALFIIGGVAGRIIGGSFVVNHASALGAAIGNVVGSSILNVLCILGVSGVISPITIDGADLRFTQKGWPFSHFRLADTSSLKQMICSAGRKLLYRKHTND